MLRFLKKKSNIPSFGILQQSAIKDKYFVRTCQWRWLNKEIITVTDKYQPRVITMDAWPQLVFLEATGDKTVSEFVFYLASKYNGKVPEELASTVLGEINTLLGERVIELRSEKTNLPDDILKPQLP